MYEPVATYHGFRYVSMTGYDVSHCKNGDCVGGRHKDVQGFARGLLTSYLVHTDVAEISTTVFYSFDPTDNHIRAILPASYLSDIRTINSWKWGVVRVRVS